MMGVSKDTIAHFQMWWLLYWHAVLAAVVLCLAVSVMVRRRFRKWPVILMLFPAAVAILWLRYCAVNPWVGYQYRLTVTLEVDGKPVSNSEVYQILKARNPIRNRLTLGGVSNEQVVVFGEAIYFSFPKSPLLVTMAGSGGQMYQMRRAFLQDRCSITVQLGCKKVLLMERRRQKGLERRSRSTNCL